MEADHHRHDTSDMKWAVLEPHLPGQRGQWGGVAHNNRRFVNAVFWIMRTGATWRDLPLDYGNWKAAHERFRRWRTKGIWEKLLELLIIDPDYKWLMFDVSRCKASPGAPEAIGDSRYMERAKEDGIPRYIWPWMRMVCQPEYLLQTVPQQIASLEKN